MALKKLKQEILNNLLQEVHVLKRLRHPNIVGFMGIYQNSFVVMEWMEGGSLLDFIRNEPNLSVSQFVTMMLQAAYGMVYLSSKNIIHRDLALSKITHFSHYSGNLLCHVVNNQLIVKVSDFGMSRVVTSSYYRSTSTEIPIPLKWTGKCENNISFLYSS